MDSKDLTLRVKSFGKNEFGVLSSTFNKLLIQLEKTQNRLIDQIEEINNEVKERKKAEEQLKIANEKLATLATIDELTGIANRRKFDEKFREALLFNRRNKGSITVLMCDVDFFKNYNDYYGHLLGDECLHQIASAISQVIRRPGDLVARYGGEEFIVMLPQTDRLGSEVVIENILNAVRMLDIEHKKSVAAECVTMSIGASVLNLSNEIDPERIISEADKALYEAKRTGRNRSVIHEF